MIRTLLVATWLFMVCCHAARSQAPLRIMAFGDSTTATRKGVDRVYADRLRDDLGKVGVAAEVINAGVRGDTTRHALERFRRDVLDKNPDVLVMQFGQNDGSVDVWAGVDRPRVPLPEYITNLETMVAGARERGIVVALMTPNPMRWTKALRDRYGKPPYDVQDPNGLDFLNRSYAEAVRTLAKRHGVRLVDVHRSFSVATTNGRPVIETVLLDGLHPNDLGHAFVSRLIAHRLRGFARGYTIPVVDISEEAQRQFVVDREQGQYLGHPTTVLLDDGKTILCVYPKGHGRGGIVYKRSTDGGRTWSDRLKTPENWSTSKEVPTLHRVVDKAGNKRIIMWSGLYPARLAVSEDEGGSWSPLKKVGDWGGIVVMGCVERMKNGDYIALFHDDGRFISAGGRRENASRFYVYQVRSKDGGLTWSQPRRVATHARAHLCEPGIIRSPDGKRLAVLLRENSRRMNGFVIFSDDEGETWSHPRMLPAALTGDRHTAVYAPDGRLFISFRDRTLDSPTHGDWVGWVGKFADIVNGTEGQYRVRIMDNTKGADCAYPGVLIQPDGTIVTTTYGHWTKGEAPYIVTVRFKLEDLDARLSR